MMSRRFEKMIEFLTFFLLNPARINKFRAFGHESYFKFNISMLSLFYTFFSAVNIFFGFSCYEQITLNTRIVLHAVQTVLPLIICIYLTTDLLKNQKIDLSLKISEALIEPNISQKCLIKLCVRLFVLVAVYSLKIYTNGPVVKDIVYAFSTIFPDFVASSSDFMFAFYVEHLTIKIEEFHQELELFNIIDMKKMKKIESRLESFQQICRNIEKFYSQRLILTIFYNFMQLVISLYWIFIRVAFNHLNFPTFLFLVQPVLCIYTVFKTPQRCLDAVRFSNKVYK